MEIRVRYAPSPTGYLHIGGARTAIFNYLFAKNQGGKFIVRIEDTDLERNIPDGISSQLDNLRWLGLVIDETIDKEGKYGPYQQTKRLDIYQDYAQKLIANNQAYYCFCTKEDLEFMKENQVNALFFQYDGRCFYLKPEEVKEKLDAKTPFSIRVRIPVDHEYVIEDLVRGKIVFHSKDLGDFVIIKTNGVATYNFAVVIDDYLMKISHVFRGEEHISNTPRQLVIYDHLQWKAPMFGHMTLIINQDGKKLSKRDGSLMQFIHQYRSQGYLPEALFNFISLLGWHPHGEREIYSIEELIKIFNSKYLSKAPSMFDVQKLLWMNNCYIKNLSDEAYITLVKPFVQASYDWKLKGDKWWNEMLLIYKRQLMYGAEIKDLISVFFRTSETMDEEARLLLEATDSNSVIKVFAEKISLLPSFDDEEGIKQVLNDVKATTKVSGKALFMPIRIATTLQMHGPELPKTIKLLGKETVLARLKALNL